MELHRFQGDLTALAMELPEDIARLKAHGDLELAGKVIERRLEKPLPEMLRKRLVLEQEILRLLPLDYPFDWESGVKAAQEMFRDFKEEELQRLLEDGALEWIYLNGSVHLKNNFVLNLVKTREELAERILQSEILADKLENFRMLEQVIGEMKRNESVSCQFHVRSAMKLSPARLRPGTRIQDPLPLPVLGSQVTQVEVLDCQVRVPGCEGAVLKGFVRADSGTDKGMALKTDGSGSIRIAPEDYPQRTVCFETVYQPGMEFSTEFTFETKMRYWDWRQAAERLRSADGGRPTEAGRPAEVILPEEALAPYLSEQLPHIRFTPYLRSLTAEVVGEETDPLKKAKRIYDFITTRVMYSFFRSYCTIEKQVYFTATNLKGDCGLQALLFITMCRIAGIPARWQSGLYTNPRGIGHHDWAQFYLEPYGWLYADCSFGGAAYRAGHMERWEFYFGNLEPYRLVAASEFQKEFYFSKKHLRHDPYDNQSGEAEYEDMGLAEKGDYETRHELLNFMMQA